MQHHVPAPRRLTSRIISPLTITTIGFVLLAFFFVWTASVLLPVLAVEMGYQYHKTLTDVFHTQTLKGLILPQFRIIVDAASSHTRNGGITIPAIFVDEPIIFNVDPNDQKSYLAALKKGIAHASSTALPGTGNIGYYFAHSSSPGFVRQLNAIFYLLGKLKPGDIVYVWKDGEHFDYTVTQTVITSPSDVSFLHRQYPKETIVLQTCWPPGTTLERLLVFAERRLQ